MIPVDGRSRTCFGMHLERAMSWRKTRAIQTLASLIGLAASAVSLGHTEGPSRPDEHAPISVMGDHYHEGGEVMFSYRYMTMSMAGNVEGTDSLSPAQISTTVPNRFFGRPMQPPTLRVVPTEMNMDMHMVGSMYAPTDRVTLVGMLSHVTKEMKHVTFAGATGTQTLGTFTTRASGLGDTSLAALVRLRERDAQRLHLTAGFTLPTGDIDAEDEVLAPTGMRPTLRLPYPMQLGSGTYDLTGALTYTRFGERGSWGAQWRSTFRTGDNDEGYRFGDEHRVTAWLSRLLSARLSWSARVEAYDRGNIHGMDPLIVAPVQTADPLKQGATRVDAAVGLNYISPREHRVAFEMVVPLRQDLDGPQLETDWRLTAGYQFTF